MEKKKKVLSSKTNLRVLIPGLVEKLGDTKIVIRQLAQEALRALSDTIKHGSLLALMTPFLESPNWHTREEILIFIITLFLRHGQNKDKENPAENTIKENEDTLEEIDYANLVNSVAKLLDDDKPKVVQIVYETLATIAHLGERTKTLELLLEVVDQEIYRKLCDRIEANKLPILKPDGSLEFPYLTTGLITQNSFYNSSQGGFRISMGNISVNPLKSGEGMERYTSAGPIKLNKTEYDENAKNNDSISNVFFHKIYHNNKEKATPVKQVMPNTVRSGSVETKYGHVQSQKPNAITNSLKKYTRASLANRTAASSSKPESTEQNPFVFFTISARKQENNEENKKSPAENNLKIIKKSPPKYQKSPNSKAEETDQYLTLEQLLPLDQPDEELKCALDDLKSSDWSKQFDACNTLRRACVHHSELITTRNAGQVHSMILDMIKIAESLRSSLVKNCVLAFTGFFY